MYRETKLVPAGASAAVHLPKEMLERHHLDSADRVFVVDTADGILITSSEPTFAAAVQIAETGATKYRKALRRVAE